MYIQHTVLNFGILPFQFKGPAQFRIPTCLSHTMVVGHSMEEGASSVILE
jgi:hypothetical protein